VLEMQQTPESSLHNKYLPALGGIGSITNGIDTSLDQNEFLSESLWQMKL
jgi:hypothetical protein